MPLPRGRIDAGVGLSRRPQQLDSAPAGDPHDTTYRASSALRKMRASRMVEGKRMQAGQI